MKSTDAPQKQPIPFGSNGPRDAITATTPSGSNQASYDQGFPPITMTLKSAGGLPPKGQDMNQILFEQSSFNRYYAAGGGYAFDSAFSAGIGGYPAGARIPNTTLNGFWVNTIEDNSTNPENSTGALTGWIPQDSYGITSITGLTSSSVTLTSLQASKDRIVLTGALTANINIVVPAWVKRWEVVNNTTGSFTVTIKTPSGSGVSISSGSTAMVIGDGTNIINNYSPGALIGVQYFVGTATYVPTVGTRSIIVEAVGGGGAGGGAAATGAGAVSVGSGGTAGSYGKGRYTSGFSGALINVGNGGLPTASESGGDGGDSSFGGLLIARGGRGGIRKGPASPNFGVTGSSIGGGTSGANLVSAVGAPGGFSLAASLTAFFAGLGAPSHFGGGGTLSTANSNGVDGTAPGSGGSGAFQGENQATSRSGGAGSRGLIIVWEYA